MEIRTFRAPTLREALLQVQAELGEDAAVLETRTVRRGWLGWLTGARDFVVTASVGVRVPSQFPAHHTHHAPSRPLPPPATGTAELERLTEGLTREHATGNELPEALFQLFTDLIEAEVSEELAQELVDRLRRTGADLDDPVLMKARIARMIEEEIAVSGALRVVPGQRRLVALVGPTGVGKTTTIAKLAAHYHLRERRRVGLITVDTYRIAAVDQLRTYADIIDLPMEVVSTPREMRQAMQRLQHMELILMDTAGRSPQDEVKVLELKSMLGEAQADEVHLVLSSVSSLASLKRTADQFACVGITSLIFTKLDEATGLGNLIPLLRHCRLPISYITNGQNVPDDIEPADRRRLARVVLGMESIR